MYKFIENLRLQEARQSSDLYQLVANNITNEQVLRKRKYDRYREEKITTYTARLENGEISIETFLDLISSIRKKKKRRQNIRPSNQPPTNPTVD